MATQFFLYILVIFFVNVSSQESQQIKLFEIKESLVVEVKFETLDGQLADNFTLKLSNYGNLASYVYEKDVTPKQGLNITNKTKNMNKASKIHTPFYGSITIGKNQFDNYKIFVMHRNFGPSEYGVLDLVSLEPLLQSKIWSIYLNGNDSKLTLGSLDTDNCEDMYYWFDYKIKRVKVRSNHPKINQKIIKADVGIYGEFLENITITIMDINDDKVVVPRRFIESIKRIAGTIYNEETNELTYNCSSPIQIQFYLSKNKYFTYNFNQQIIYNEEKCFFKVFIGNDNNNIKVGLKNLLFKKCIADNFRTHQIGFSKSKNH